MFHYAPAFDFLAMQDGAGTGSYDFGTILPYVSAVAYASRASNRAVWSNAEVSEYLLHATDDDDDDVCAHSRNTDLAQRNAHAACC